MFRLDCTSRSRTSPSLSTARQSQNRLPAIVTTSRVARGEFHPQVLPDPDVSVCALPAPSVRPLPDAAIANVQTALAPNALRPGPSAAHADHASQATRLGISNGFAFLKGSSRLPVDLSVKLDSVASSLQRYYSLFIATARNSAPLPHIGTRILTVLPLGCLPSHRGARFPRSTQEPEAGSRRFHAGRHLGSRQVSPGLLPG